MMKRWVFKVCEDIVVPSCEYEYLIRVFYRATGRLGRCKVPIMGKEPIPQVLVTFYSVPLVSSSYCIGGFRWHQVWLKARRYRLLNCFKQTESFSWLSVKGPGDLYFCPRIIGAFTIFEGESDTYQFFDWGMVGYTPPCGVSCPNPRKFVCSF